MRRPRIAVFLLTLLLLAPARAVPEPAPTSAEPDANLCPADPDQEMADRQSERLETIFQIAETFVEAERWDEAVKEFEKVLAFEPPAGAGPLTRGQLLRDKSRACTTLADLLTERKNDKEKALGLLHRGIDLIDKLGASDRASVEMKVDLLRRAAALHKERKEFDQAIELLRRAEALQAK